ncbi:2390_t:CDS:1, partial [Acaulospora colombiana]
YACDEGIARVFQTGVTPVVMAEFTSGFNISEDLALRREFWDLYGFKKSEIELLLDNTLGLSSDVKEGITKWLKEENDGYFFNPYQTEGIFNPARILYCIKQMMVQKKFIDERIQDTSIIINNLLGFPPDPQTLPSQSTLDLI